MATTITLLLWTRRLLVLLSSMVVSNAAWMPWLDMPHRHRHSPKVDTSSSHIFLLSRDDVTLSSYPRFLSAILSSKQDHHPLEPPSTSLLGSQIYKNLSTTPFLILDNDHDEEGYDSGTATLSPNIWKVDSSDALGSILMQMPSSYHTLDGSPHDNTTFAHDQLTAFQNNSSENNNLRKEFRKKAKKPSEDEESVAQLSKNIQNERNSRRRRWRQHPNLVNANTTSSQNDVPFSSFDPESSDQLEKQSIATAAPTLFRMTLETAKELDEAVVKVKTANDNHLEHDKDDDMIKLIQLPSFYTSTDNRTIYQFSSTASSVQQQLSSSSFDEEQEKKSLTRDLRKLAVSIAGRTQSVQDWTHTVSPQIGGVWLLLDAIRVGAQVATTMELGFSDEQEEDVWIATQACRALRDLCALSPELAAVLVDSMLRANQYAVQHDPQHGGLLRDLCRLMQSVRCFNNHHNFVVPGNANPEIPVMTTTSEMKVRSHARLPIGRALSFFSQFKRRSASRRPMVPQQDGWKRGRRNQYYCQLHVTQLLLAMAIASDDAVRAIRSCPQLQETILQSSSYAKKELRRRWLRYPYELGRWWWNEQRQKRKMARNNNNNEQQDGNEVLRGRQEDDKSSVENTTSSSEEKTLFATQNRPTQRYRRPFIEATSLSNDGNGEIRKTSNQILAAIGCNRWIPKTPGQRGLRILTLDGGGSRGMASVTAARCLVEACGPEVCESFDMICGTSTGGIIAFLIGLRKESCSTAVERYNQLIRQIFVKSALSTPLMLFTTASYDESPFNKILSGILNDDNMLDSRSDPTTPLVFCVSSKMSSTPTHIALFRNYNYANGELPDPFTIRPEDARAQLELPLEMEHPNIRNGHYRTARDEKKKDVVLPGQRPTTQGSRHPGSFRVLQRYALRASTAAPTFFRPVMMGGEMYCDGGIVTSNPTAVAIHEARTLFPDVPIELVVSIGTGLFYEQKSAPRIGWDGIIGQIVNSATDGEQVHHILEDILGDTATLGQRSSVLGTRYFRFNPVIGYPDSFPIDETDPKRLENLKKITIDYMNEPNQRIRLEEITEILKGRYQWKSFGKAGVAEPGATRAQ